MFSSWHVWICMKFLPLDIQQQSINQSNYKEEDYWITLSGFTQQFFVSVTNQELDLQLIFLISMIWSERLGLWCLTPFNNISVISWQSVLLVEETGVPSLVEKNHRPVESHWQNWSHQVASSTPRHERGSNS